MISDLKPIIPNLNIDKANESIMSESMADALKGLKSTTSRTQRKLTNQERQNAIFGPQKEIEPHTSATKQYHQLEECQKNANQLFSQINEGKQILQESISILSEQIQQENTDIFTEIREKMKKLHQNFEIESQNAYQDMNKLEGQVIDLRKQKLDIYDQLCKVKGMFARNYDNIGYNNQDMQSLQNSSIYLDSITPDYANLSTMHNNN